MKQIALVLVIVSAGLLRAEVKTQQKNQMQFPGMMGRMMGMFGGRAMREGTVETVAVKGNRKITVNDATGSIVDLDEEKVYELDMKAKTYKVTTFDEMRRRMLEAQERAKNSPAAQKSSAEPKNDAKQMQIDFDLKESGQKKDINGYNCREVVMTITVHEKDKTLEQSGGMVMTTHEWLAPRIAAMKEITDFDRRYAEKLRPPSLFAVGAPSADQMAAAAAMYPMLKDAMGKFQAENVNMDGTPILMVMTTDTVANPEQMQQQQQQPQQAQQNDNTTNVPTSIGGLIGGFGRRAARNRSQQQQQQQQESGSSTPGRSTMMTMNHEVIKVATDVSAADLAIPPGFKQK